MSRKRSAEMFRSVLITLLLAVTTSVQASSLEALCSGATPADLNSSLRAHAGQEGEPFLVRLEIPSPGLLSVDVTVSGSAAAEPMLALMNRACGTSPATGEVQILERSTGHMVVAARGSGTYLLGISSRDPRQPLADFKLSSGFVPDDPSRGVFTKDGEDEEEIEIEVDPLTGSGRDFFKDGEDEEEIEIEVDPLVYRGDSDNRSLHSRLDQLCRSGEVDDHGDSFTCATFMTPGQELSGDIRNDWGDDIDVFHFVLGSPRDSLLWTVSIDIDAADVSGALHDRSGQRLATTGGDGTDSRIVSALAPGAYFVRVEGRHSAQGSYDLRLRTSPW